MTAFVIRAEGVPKRCRLGSDRGAVLRHISQLMHIDGRALSNRDGVCDPGSIYWSLQLCHSWILVEHGHVCPTPYLDRRMGGVVRHVGSTLAKSVEGPEDHERSESEGIQLPGPSDQWS
jgi:hypothetical protein